MDKEEKHIYDLKNRSQLRGNGIGGFFKPQGFSRRFVKPFGKKESKQNNVGYFDDCRTCQQYGRVLHEIEKGSDNKAFVSDEEGDMEKQTKSTNKK